MRTLGTISSTRELAALPIALSGGRSVRLDSIADVRDQAADPTQLALLDGKPVIGFQVMRAWGEGAVKVADGARAAVKQLQTQYPNIQITEINSVADTRVRESFHSSMTMLIEGSILAIIVVWFFLRDIRATLISATALPLAESAAPDAVTGFVIPLDHPVDAWITDDWTAGEWELPVVDLR